MTIFFLLNPSRPRQRRNVRALALNIARRQGHTVYFGEVDRGIPDSMDSLLEQAFKQNCTRIIAVGGDGTYNRLLRLLAAKNKLGHMEIGLVPSGTCNDFVRVWRPAARRWREALRFACSAPALQTDLGELNGDLFLNNAGFGRRSGPARSKVNAFRTLRQFNPVPLRVTWEQGALEGLFYMGLVCNSPFFSKGLYFSKAVRLDDGCLDIFLVPKMPKAKMAAVLLLGRLGRSLRSRQLITLRLKQLEISSDRDLWPQVDGEPAGALPVRHLRFSVASVKALIVRPA